MTYTITRWSPVATSNGTTMGAFESTQGLLDREALDLFERILAEGDKAIIVDENGAFVDPRSLGYLPDSEDRPC